MSSLSSASCASSMSIHLALSLLLLSSALFLSSVGARESLRIISPTDLQAKVGVNQLSETPALFGNPPYRSTLVGKAALVSPANGCSSLNVDFWNSGSIFAVLDRGSCNFVTKVRNAQNAGARAVLIADNVDEPAWLMPLMADDGTGSNVQIPSVLMQYGQANALKAWLNSSSDLPNSMSLTYNLPNPDNRVEWDLFTSSWDPVIVSFKEAMIPVIKVLDTLQLYRPHYYVMDGTGLGCTSTPDACGNGCINGGRYCAPDPDRDTERGLSGQDVLLEDIRQYCIWDYLNTTYGEGGNQYLLFQYMTYQNTICNDASNPDKWRNGVCQNQALATLQIPADKITQCMVASNTSDGSNTILHQMLVDLGHFGLSYFPAAYVNLMPYRGGWCTSPIPNVGCGLVDMICQGYDDADIPPVCSVQPADCPFSVTKDCSNTCGNKVMDACGACLAVNDDRFNQSCIDKSGNVCAKPLVLDVCRVCGGDGSTCVSSGGGSSSSSLSTGAIVGIVFAALFVVALVGGGVYFYLQYQSKKMREDIDSLLKQYLPLEGGVSNGGGVQQKNGRLVETASEHDL